MILTGKDVQWYIELGKLKIFPLNKEQVRQNGVDLILDQVEPFVNNFCLGCTRETIQMPNDLMAFVQLRSTWARRGWMLPPTVVDAGFHGNLTLEIVSFLEQAAPVGERFAHLIFCHLSGPTLPYSGQYQGQSGITPAKEKFNANIGTKSFLNKEKSKQTRRH